MILERCSRAQQRSLIRGKPRPAAPAAAPRPAAQPPARLARIASERPPALRGFGVKRPKPAAPGKETSETRGRGGWGERGPERGRPAGGRCHGPAAATRPRAPAFVACLASRRRGLLSGPPGAAGGPGRGARRRRGGGGPCLGGPLRAAGRKKRGKPGK